MHPHAGCILFCSESDNSQEYGRMDVFAVEGEFDGI